MKFGKSPARVFPRCIGILCFLLTLPARPDETAEIQMILTRKVAEEHAANVGLQEGEKRLRENYRANLLKTAAVAPESDAAKIRAEVDRLDAGLPLTDLTPEAPEALQLLRGTYVDALQVQKVAAQQRKARAREQASLSLRQLAGRYQQSGNLEMADRLQRLAANPNAVLEPRGAPSAAPLRRAANAGEGEVQVRLIRCEPSGMVPLPVGSARKITLAVTSSVKERTRLNVLPTAETLGGRYYIDSASIFGPGEHEISLEIKSHRPVSITGFELRLESTTDGYRYYEESLPLELRWQ